MLGLVEHCRSELIYKYLTHLRFAKQPESMQGFAFDYELEVFRPL